MKELSTLLHDAAAHPAAPLPIDGMRALVASRRRRRRLVQTCGAIVAALGIGVPGGDLLLSPASDGAAVQVVAPERTETAPTTTTPLAVHALRPAPVTRDAAPYGYSGTSASPQPTAGAPGATPLAVMPQQPAAGGDGQAATSEGCNLPEPRGQDPDNASCTYEATRAGGYVGQGSWNIIVVRNGRELRYSSVDSPACAPDGFIQPGDRVKADLGAGAGTSGGGLYVVPGTSSLHVGPDARCVK